MQPSTPRPREAPPAPKPQSEPRDEKGNRIGLDTGAYRTGVLTTMGLEGGERWFLQTQPASSAGENSPEEPPLVASRKLGW